MRINMECMEIAPVLRRMAIGEVVSYPIHRYGSVTSTAVRMNVEYRAEGRRYRTHADGLEVTVTRTA